MQNRRGSSESEEESIPLANLKNVNSYKSLIEPTCMQCEVCDQTFNTRLSSIKHNATHIIIPLLKLTLYQCDECLFHFSLEDLCSHVIKTSHHTSQFPSIKIKTSQMHTLKTFGYKKLLQSMVKKQAVIKCQDTLNEIFNLKSTDGHENEDILLNSETEVYDTKAITIEVKDDTASSIEVKKDNIYEISSESDTEEYKQKNEHKTARQQVFPEQDTQMGSSEHEWDNSSPFRKDVSSPDPIISPSYESFKNRIVYEDNDNLFEDEEILPDRPCSPKNNNIPIHGTNISMMDKTGNSFLVGRQQNKLDVLSRSYLLAIQKSIGEDSNQIVDKSINNGKPVTDSGHNFVNNRTPLANNGINNRTSVINIGNNVVNNGKIVMSIGNKVVNNGEPVTSGNIAMHNGRPNVNNEKNVINYERAVFSHGKHAVSNVIVDRNEIRNIVEESYTESVHYDELIAPQLCDCRYCGRCFSNRMEMIIHECIHMRIRPTRPVLCCICEKYLSGNYKTLRKHMLQKHPEDIDRKFRDQKRCKSCHMKYYNFFKHMRFYHLTYTCSKCRQCFDKEHINSHNCEITNTLSYKKYKVIKLCEICLAFARNKTNLHYEVTGQHSEVGTRQTCDKCHLKYFEVNLVRRMINTYQEWATKLKKPMSNTDRLKKMQNRLKVMKMLNKY